jgi:outer membrane protein, multidrug efflux system
MRSIARPIAVTVFATLLLSACSTTVDTLQHREQLGLPATWDGDIESRAPADVDWRSWFSDAGLSVLIDSALEHNAELRIAEEHIAAARADVAAASGALLPALDAFIASGQSLMSENSNDWAGSQDVTYPTGEEMTRTTQDHSIGVEAGWDVDIWGKLRDQRQSAARRYLASVERRNRLVTQVTTETAFSYYELIALDMKLRIIRESTKLRAQALEVVRMKKDVGAVNDLAVKQFEAQVLSSKGLEIELLQDILRGEATLHSLLNRFPDVIQRPEDFPPATLSMALAPGVPDALLDRRPDLREAEYELAAAELDVAAAEKAFYPALRLFADLRLNAFSTEWLFSWPQSLAYSLFGSLAAPLLNRSALKADLARAEAARRQALTAYRAAVVDAFIEVQTEIRLLRSREELLALKRQRAERLTEAVQASFELFGTGRAGYLEVLLAEEEALDARLDVVDTQLRQYESILGIYRALGGGWR